MLRALSTNYPFSKLNKSCVRIHVVLRIYKYPDKDNWSNPFLEIK